MPRLAAGETLALLMPLMYSVCVGGKTTKARLNLTIDPDIYKEARRVFNVGDLNMSAFVEMQLALFLEMVRPLTPLLEEMQAGTADPSEVKSALRGFLSHSHGMIGGELQKFGAATGEISAFLDAERTDKK